MRIEAWALSRPCCSAGNTHQGVHQRALARALGPGDGHDLVRHARVLDVVAAEEGGHGGLVEGARPVHDLEHPRAGLPPVGGHAAPGPWLGHQPGLEALPAGAERGGGWGGGVVAGGSGGGGAKEWCLGRRLWGGGAGGGRVGGAAGGHLPPGAHILAAWDNLYLSLSHMGFLHRYIKLMGGSPHLISQIGWNRCNLSIYLSWGAWGSLTWSLFMSLLTHRLVLLRVDAYRFVFWDLPGDVLAAPEPALCGWIGKTSLSLSLGSLGTSALRVASTRELGCLGAAWSEAWQPYYPWIFGGGDWRRHCSNPAWSEA